MKKYLNNLLMVIRDLKQNLTAIAILVVGILVVTGATQNAGAQKSKPTMKLGAYYFAGWAGKCPYDDGTPENAWAKGMPTHYTKQLATTFSGRTPIWGWRDDSQELTEKQIDLAADNGIAYFSYCWYWKDNKGPINVSAIEKDSKHLPMQMFMKAKNNSRMEFCLLIANHAGAEIVGTEAWKQAADYWIGLFKHPRYLQMDGKPVLMIFLPNGSDKEGLAYLQSAAIKAGFPGVTVVGCGSGKPEDGFTVKTYYNVKVPNIKVSEKHAFQELVGANEKGWKGIPEQPLIPVATVGWDRRPWEAIDGTGFGKGVPVSGYYEKGTQKEFRNYMEKLAKWMAAHPEQVTKDRLALLYAWNEIGEGGYLVPTKDDPKGGYLKAIRRVVYGN